MSRELQKKLVRERQARREAEALLGERSLELTKAQAEIEALRSVGPSDPDEQWLHEILAKLHAPMRELLQSLTELFGELPSGVLDSQKDDVRTAVSGLLSVAHSIQETQEDLVTAGMDPDPEG